MSLLRQWLGGIRDAPCIGNVCRFYVVAVSLKHQWWAPCGPQLDCTRFVNIQMMCTVAYLGIPVLLFPGSGLSKGFRFLVAWVRLLLERRFGCVSMVPKDHLEGRLPVGSISPVRWGARWWRVVSQHQYLRVLTEIFCLWRVTYSDESAQAILYHFPGPQASLHPPPPFYWLFIWNIKLLKTLCFCTRSLEINQWNVHRFTPVKISWQTAKHSCIVGIATYKHLLNDDINFTKSSLIHF